MKLSQKVKRNRTKKCGCRCPECEYYSSGKYTLNGGCGDTVVDEEIT